MIHQLLKKQGVGEKLLITWHCWACLLGQVPPKSTDRGFERVNTRVVLPTHPRRVGPGLPASTSASGIVIPMAGSIQQQGLEQPRPVEGGTR